MIDQMNETMVKAIFETLPMEITVIDANDEVVGWNKHETRLFKRPLDLDGNGLPAVPSPKKHPFGRTIVNEMREGQRDKANFWIDLPIGVNGEKHKVLIEFYALRDESGKYLGCMECTQDVEGIRKIEGEKRLLG